jgi:hypothetical protein
MPTYTLDLWFPATMHWQTSYIASEQTAEKTPPLLRQPIVACLAITKELVLPLLTRQTYSVHVTIFLTLQYMTGRTILATSQSLSE